jgi:16S rRNA (guanine527-N7)-methyltransferase
LTQIKTLNITEWEKFADWCKNLGLILSSDKLENSQTFHQLLLDWNQRINLVSRRDIDRLVSYHFIDSVSAIPEILLNSTVCDLGAGAGLPGIPIKIIRDDINMYLVESIQKKANFLSEAVKTLELKNTIVLNQRAETIKDIKFDVILVRLFGKIPDVLPLASKLLSPKGKIIFYKIQGVEKEIEQASKITNKYKLKLSAVKDVKLPITDILRKLVIYKLVK